DEIRSTDGGAASQRRTAACACATGLGGDQRRTRTQGSVGGGGGCAGAADTLRGRGFGKDRWWLVRCLCISYSAFTSRVAWRRRGLARVRCQSAAGSPGDSDRRFRFVARAQGGPALWLRRRAQEGCLVSARIQTGGCGGSSVCGVSAQ